MNKVHAIGVRKIGTRHRTACNAYMAQDVMTVGEQLSDRVTCKACLKALGKVAK